MAIFSEKIVSAKFLDSPNNMIIEVLYQEDDSVIPYVLEVDFTNQDFNDLLQEVTLEEIEKSTQATLKAESDVFEKMINDEIERRWAIESQKVQKAYDDVDAYARKLYDDLDKYAEQQKRIKFEEVQQEYTELRKQLQEKFSTEQNKTTLDTITGKDILGIIELKNDDQDFIFNTKIAVLEDPVIAGSKDKSLKLNIRKTKVLKDLLSIYFSQKAI